MTVNPIEPAVLAAKTLVFWHEDESLPRAEKPRISTIQPGSVPILERGTAQAPTAYVYTSLQTARREAKARALAYVGLHVCGTVLESLSACEWLDDAGVSWIAIDHRLGKPLLALTVESLHAALLDRLDDGTAGRG